MSPKVHSTDAVLNRLKDLVVELQLLDALFMGSLMENNSSLNYEEVSDHAVKLIREYLTDLDFNIVYNGENAIFYLAGEISPVFNGKKLFKLINWLNKIIG